MQIWVGESAFTLQQIQDENRWASLGLNPVFRFLQFWFSNADRFLAHSSGSTGPPKDIWLSRSQILASAQASLNYFHIQPKVDGLLLCLSAEHVGGFMVLARALAGSIPLWILPPDRQPFPLNSPLLRQKKWFVSLVPLQLQAFAQNPELIASTAHWKGILLGGAAISPEQIELVKKLQCPVYHSYGMSETASHIAIRQLHPMQIPLIGYKALPGVELKMGPQQNLCIKGPMTNDEWIETTDALAWLNQDEFELAGRIDEAINTGGLKVMPDLLKNTLRENPFFKTVNMEVFGLPDPILGERVTLVVEAQSPDTDWQKQLQEFNYNADSRTLPKAVFLFEKFPLTPSLKTDKQTLKMQLSNCKPTWIKK